MYAIFTPSRAYSFHSGASLFTCSITSVFNINSLLRIIWNNINIDIAGRARKYDRPRAETQFELFSSTNM